MLRDLVQIVEFGQLRPLLRFEIFNRPRFGPSFPSRPRFLISDLKDLFLRRPEDRREVARRHGPFVNLCWTEVLNPCPGGAATFPCKVNQRPGGIFTTSRRQIVFGKPPDSKQYSPDRGVAPLFLGGFPGFNPG